MYRNQRFQPTKGNLSRNNPPRGGSGVPHLKKKSPINNKRLFNYLEKLTKDYFIGIIEITFQNGYIRTIKQHNNLPSYVKLVKAEINTIFETIQRWIDNHSHGIIKIPFDLGCVGVPLESKALKLEEL